MRSHREKVSGMGSKKNFFIIKKRSSTDKIIRLYFEFAHAHCVLKHSNFVVSTFHNPNSNLHALIEMNK